MTTRTLLMLVAALATAALSSSPAYADSGVVLVYGDAPQHQRDVVTSAATGAVRDASWSLLDPPLPEREIATVMICLPRDRPWPCFESTASLNGIGRMIVVKVDRKTTDLVVTGQLLVGGDSIPAIERRVCESCTDAALAASVVELTKLLLERTASRLGTTAITLHAEPSDAIVTLDGKMLGAANRTITTTPGEHLLLVQRTGYQQASQKVVVPDGTTIEISMTLQRDGATVAPPPARRSRLLPGVMMGVGAATVIGCAWYSWTVDPPNTPDQPRYLYSGPAIAGAMVGAAVLGAGVYLWLRKPNTSSTPVAFTIPGGGVVGWAAKF